MSREYPFMFERVLLIEQQAGKLDPLLNAVTELRPISRISLSLLDNGLEGWELPQHDLVLLQLPAALDLAQQAIQHLRLAGPGDAPLVLVVTGAAAAQVDKALLSMADDVMHACLDAPLARYRLEKLFRRMNLERTLRAGKITQEKNLVRQLGLQQLLAKTAMDLARPIPEAQLDSYLDTLLSQLGRLFDVDRCYLFSIDSAISRASNTHEWCGPGISPQIEQLRAIPLHNLRWWIKQLADSPVLEIASVDAMPLEARNEQKLLQSQQIRSLLLVSMHDDKGHLAGFMGFDSVRSERQWSEHERTALLTMNAVLRAALQQHSTRRLLRQQDNRSQALLAALPDMMFVMNQDGFIIDFSAPDTEQLLLPPEQFLNQRFKDVLPLKLGSRFQQAIDRAIDLGQVVSFDYELEINGEGRSFEARLVRTRDELVVSIVRDITSRKLMERQLREAASVFEHASEGIFITDGDSAIRRVNRGFTRLTGYTADDVVGKNPSFLSAGRHSAADYQRLWKTLQSTGHWSGEMWNRRKDGESIAVLQTITAIRDAGDQPDGYLALMTDLTEIKQQRDQLQRMARHDPLTGLGNRTQLLADLQQASTTPNRSLLALIQFDLDDFKEINKQFGKPAGDEVLIRVARRLEAYPGHFGMPARLGGDEFGLLLDACNDRNHCRRMIEQLRCALHRPLRIGAETLQLEASIGVAYSEAGNSVDPETLLRQADQAMFQAKQFGKNQWVEFDQESDREARRAHRQRNRIEQGLEQGEFILHFQPQVNMLSGQIVGMEALVRWDHPRYGLLPPRDFLPVISNHPLAIALGDKVLGMAMAHYDRWLDEGYRLAICVNIDGFQLNHPDFPAKLEAVLAQHPRLQPEHLQLEVLETSALEDMARTNRNMQACIRLGVGFSIDDFGTGFSSLGYLQDLPARTLKIDRRFVSGLPDDEGSLQIVKAIIALARSFNLMLIAEGAETEVQIKQLLELGCEVFQGYAIARPMPGEAVIEWLRQWQASRAMPPSGHV